MTVGAFREPYWDHQRPREGPRSTVQVFVLSAVRNLSHVRPVVRQVLLVAYCPTAADRPSPGGRSVATGGHSDGERVLGPNGVECVWFAYSAGDKCPHCLLLGPSPKGRLRQVLTRTGEPGRASHSQSEPKARRQASEGEELPARNGPGPSEHEDRLR